MDKDTRYNQFKSDLLELMKDIPQDEKKLVSGLVERLAFLQITIEDLESDIKANGTFELTKTRPRKLRERPAVKTYNAMIKNYTAAMKQLLDRLPSRNDEAGDDELLSFLRGSL
jgi:hypothetical protein